MNPKKNKAFRRARLGKKAENIAKFVPKQKVRKCRECSQNYAKELMELGRLYMQELEALREKYKKLIDTVDPKSIKLAEDGKIYCKNHLKK
jgi:hypothetical protein